MRLAMVLWWNHLRVQQKVWLTLLVILVPLIGALALEVSLINRLLALQTQDQDIALAQYRVERLRRLAVDIEGAFRGYLLTGQDTFLRPLKEADPKLEPTVAQVLAIAERIPSLSADLHEASDQVRRLLESKKTLVRQIQTGHRDDVLEYVRAGKGLALSDALRWYLRKLEDRLGEQAQSLQSDRSILAQQAFNWSLFAVGGTFLMGWLGVRLLTRSITRPLATVQMAAEHFGSHSTDSEQAPQPIMVVSTDEIGQLARSFEEMARQVHRQIRELEALGTIGQDINAIGPDGLYGVLRRITDRAAELLQAEVCLVLLRDERMSCWIVEAASDSWHDHLHKSVLLWEELPIAVRAFETGQPAVCNDLGRSFPPELVSRQLIGDSMLALPLIYQGHAFGVLASIRVGSRIANDWNMHLARGFAAEAAIAISNARLYEAAHTKQQGLEVRLRQLEHLAESLAHDLSGPGERIEGLAGLLAREYGTRLDERANHWLQLLVQHGHELIERVEGILEVARLGGTGTGIEAVDPAVVLNDVLKARAGELEHRRARVVIDAAFSMVACHRAYLRQIFDNLISNAVKFSGDRSDLEIRVSAKRRADQLCIGVHDNGIGIPSLQRERVFEPFFRLNPGATKGSGIGLSIVKRIVELYGGRVVIDGNDRGGCSVSFTLPLLGQLTKSASPNPRKSLE
jgi:signal transduction histidine kinase/CHASE3 domain sensor protein/HAMP domain-containing protein